MPGAFAPHLAAFRLCVRDSFIAVAAHAYKPVLANFATPHAATAPTAHTTAQPALPALALEMPAEKYDDEDEVGTGLYVLIGCAAVTVVLMYSWIGWTLYQGFKARRKVD